ncbi:MAG: hypothetical protein GZ094_18695 [Mariniphaga sp.]|nr:hypothetical protein [Mariniphaga sp.]
MAIGWLINKGNTLSGAIEANRKLDEPIPTWTGKGIFLLEIILSTQEAGFINHGNLTTKFMTDYFAEVFNISIKDGSGGYGDMRGRVKSRTPCLDLLKKLLEEKMDRDDAKDRKRRK